MICGRYGFSVWPTWFSVVADIVLLWPIWYVAGMVAPLPVWSWGRTVPPRKRISSNLEMTCRVGVFWGDVVIMLLLNLNLYSLNRFIWLEVKFIKHNQNYYLKNWRFDLYQRPSSEEAGTQFFSSWLNGKTAFLTRRLPVMSRTGTRLGASIVFPY